MIDTEKVKCISQAITKCNRCNEYSKDGALCTNEKESGLNYTYPLITPIKIMFVAESPPAPGKGFFYNKDSMNNTFKKKLFKLINMSGLGEVHSLEDFNNKSYYLADAINCRWDKSKKKSLPKKVFQNCLSYLKDQIELFKPKYIVAMGRNAKKSLQLEPSLIKNIIIIEMSFILMANNETDKQRISKLSIIAGHLQL